MTLLLLWQCRNVGAQHPDAPPLPQGTPARRVWSVMADKQPELWVAVTARRALRLLTCWKQGAPEDEHVPFWVSLEALMCRV